jgi:hypothetical protein
VLDLDQPSRASAIAMELQGMKAQRPLTHDLLKQILVSLGGDLAEVVISASRTPFAELLIRRDDHVFGGRWPPTASRSRSDAGAHLHQRPAARTERRRGRRAVPNPSLEADKLKEYLERMDPQDFGKFNPRCTPTGTRAEPGVILTRVTLSEARGRAHAGPSLPRV